MTDPQRPLVPLPPGGLATLGSGPRHLLGTAVQDALSVVSQRDRADALAAEMEVLTGEAPATLV